jgi:hypothetical protein
MAYFSSETLGLLRTALDEAWGFYRIIASSRFKNPIWRSAF